MFEDTINLNHTDFDLHIINILSFKDQLTLKEFGSNKKAHSQVMVNRDSYCCENLSDDFRALLKEESPSTM